MQLTRERIITAAVELIEREGVDAVSMRRIATELGSGVMSLYNHVPSKAALLDGVAERVISSIDVTSEPGASWADEVRAQARAFRQIARAYPRCTMVAVSRPTTSTSEPPPVEHALATLRSAGFGEEDALRIVRAFVAYVVGSLLREVGVSPRWRGSSSRTSRRTRTPIMTPTSSSASTCSSARSLTCGRPSGIDRAVTRVTARALTCVHRTCLSQKHTYGVRWRPDVHP